MPLRPQEKANYVPWAPISEPVAEEGDIGAKCSWKKGAMMLQFQ